MAGRGMWGTSPARGKTGGPSQEAPPAPVTHSTDDFPLEQSWDDTQCSAFDQVISINSWVVHPETGLTFPHFVLIRDRLY